MDSSRQFITLSNLDPSKSYYVRVLAVVCDGKGKPSPWVGVRTARSLHDADSIVVDPDDQPVNDEQG